MSTRVKPEEYATLQLVQRFKDYGCNLEVYRRGHRHAVMPILCDAEDCMHIAEALYQTPDHRAIALCKGHGFDAWTQAHLKAHGAS